MTQWNFLLLKNENMKLLITFYSLGEIYFKDLLRSTKNYNFNYNYLITYLIFETIRKLPSLWIFKKFSRYIERSVC